jgi:polysaccharide deacetylase family protein (PEP-CTERM system associated)
MKILTFDIEDWFHILDNPDSKSVHSWSKFENRIDSGVGRILEVLEDNDLKATFFILGWIADKYPQIVKKIDQAGHHIGSHSYAHQLAYQQSVNDFSTDLKHSKSVIEDAIGKMINSYRAPGFSITEENLWAFEELVNNGFEIDSSVFPAGRAHGGLPRFKTSLPAITTINGVSLKIFPINSRRFLGKSFIYSGGGYFRLIPRALLTKWFREDKYIMTYFHPRDFDPEQPIMPGLNYMRRFKSYVGLSKSLQKLNYILKENKFISLDAADKMIDWQNIEFLDLNIKG